MATVGHPGQASEMQTETPDILSYYPAAGDALRFWSLRKDKNVHSEIPWGFPAHIDAPMVWQGSDMEKQSDAWIVLLSEADVLALEGAMDDFHSTAKGLVLSRVKRDAKTVKD